MKGIVEYCEECSHHIIKADKEGLDPEPWCGHPERKDSLLNKIPIRDFIEGIIPSWCPLEEEE